MTQREKVMKHLVLGYTDYEIAEIINRDVNTVKYHVKEIRKRFKFANRTRLAVALALTGTVMVVDELGEMISESESKS